jgi:hypothetical protein
MLLRGLYLASCTLLYVDHITSHSPVDDSLTMLWCVAGIALACEVLALVFRRFVSSGLSFCHVRSSGGSDHDHPPHSGGLQPSPSLVPRSSIDPQFVAAEARDIPK